MPRLWALLAAAHVSLLPRLTLAEGKPLPGDTTYGRLEGELEFALGAGVTVASYGPRPQLELRARYLSMAGVFVTYEDSLGASSDPVRLLAAGVELRPLFVGRWLQGRELGNPYADLFIDSLALELGAFFAQPRSDARGSWGEGVRTGLQASFGLAFPLLGRAEGFFLTAHAGGRFSDGSAAGVPGPGERAAFATFGIAWHETIAAGLLK